jgi:biopolymer transport protein ExbD
MARFRKKKADGQQRINTASLPDIIFMLLFFFMVTTVMRETTMLVKIKLPEATEVQKL